MLKEMVSTFLGLIATPAFAFSHGLAATPPCDIVTCAEAYSVTRAMTAGYSGALFQLYNGSTTLDIGQVNGKVDMTTWSTFCSGVASNCVYAKFYAQIQGHANDLVPSVVSAPFGPDCSGGTIYKCAAPFTIEAATGLPAISTTTAQEYNIGGSDTAATGIPGGNASVTVLYNGKSVQTGSCCGMFGISHKYNAADTQGTDFLIDLSWGTSSLTVCGSASSFCLAIDEEGQPGPPDQADYGTAVINLLAVVTFDQSANRVTGAVNNRTVFNNSPPANATLTPGNFIHLGGGGDLSQPAPVFMREGLIMNSAMSSVDKTANFTSARTFYNVLQYP